MILLSMGVGIATMRPVMLAYHNDPSNIPSVININVNSSGEFLFKDELDQLAGENLKHYWLRSRQAFYQTIETLAPISDALYYVVGSDGFIKEVISRLRLHHVKDRDIILDKKDEVLADYFG